MDSSETADQEGILTDISIEPGGVEVNFTYHYSLKGAVKFINNENIEELDRSFYNKKVSNNNPDFSYRFIPFSNSQAASYFSNHFLDEVLLCHFHIDYSPTVVDPTKFKTNSNELGGGVNFKLGSNFPEHLEPIGNIEVSIWRFGYLSMIIRLINEVEISPAGLLKCIRHPELISFNQVADGEQKPGSLILKVEEFRKDLDLVLVEILNELKLTRLEYKTGEWAPCSQYEILDLVPVESNETKPDSQSEETEDRQKSCENVTQKLLPLKRSRPYIGTIFTGEKVTCKSGKSLISKKDIMLLIIAAGRTTPAFLKGFDNAQKYLEEGRDVYGAGTSFVFVARRGWSVYNSNEQEEVSFRLGVVETTHNVISIINTAARNQRDYCRIIYEEGSDVLSDLNKTVHRMVKRIEEREVSQKRRLGSEHLQYIFGDSDIRREFHKKIGRSTSFLARARLVSPCHDKTGLLESHLIGNTSRRAVNRAQTLFRLTQLRTSSQELMKNFTGFFQTSKDFLNLISFRRAKAQFAIFLLIVIPLSLLNMFDFNYKGLLAALYVVGFLYWIGLFHEIGPNFWNEFKGFWNLIRNIVSTKPKNKERS